MGLGDRLRRLFGRKTQERVQQTDTDTLLELPTAAIQLEELGYTMVQEAGLCFDTDTTAETLGELVSVIESVNDAPVRTAGDRHGYRWLVVSGRGIEDLATGLAFAVEEIEAAGHGDGLLAAAVGFQNEQTAYLIYSFERGRYYPFVPTGTTERDSKTEFKLRSLLDPHLPIEPDESEWYPLWPDSPTGHPWES